MVAVFFYGLFMDAELLRGRGVSVYRPSRAHVDGYRLALGQRATLVPAAGFTAHGMLMYLEPADVERLYAEPSVSAYRPETVRAVLESGETLQTVCYNLSTVHDGDPPNRDYARRLLELGTRLGLPLSYLATIKQVADRES